MLEALEGQPDECGRPCFPDPDGEHILRWNDAGDIQPDAPLGGVVGRCPDCHGTGDNHRGYLPKAPPCYEQLKQQVTSAIGEGELSRWPDDEQRADWAYGNTKIENEDVTREMAERAAREK